MEISETILATTARLTGGRFLAHVGRDDAWHARVLGPVGALLPAVAAAADAIVLESSNALVAACGELVVMAWVDESAHESLHIGVCSTAEQARIQAQDVATRLRAWQRRAQA